MGRVAAGNGLARPRQDGIDAAMALGSPTHHEVEIDLGIDVTHELIDWASQEVGFGSVPEGTSTPQGLSFEIVMGLTWASFGESIVVTLVAPQRVRIRSECSSSTQIFDWGKNARNVRALVRGLRMAAQAALSRPPFR
jgi:hypothetical protein